MDTVATPKTAHLTTAQKEIAVPAAELINIFNQYADKMTTLSLDCFGTLLWRKTATPKDVFYDLQHYPTFQSHGITALARIHAEELARKIKMLEFGTDEVTLRDIYCTFPSLTAEQIDTLIEDELSAEIEASYAFPRVIELIRIAHARGIKVVLMSDTYFEENQLQHILVNTLPEDVMTAIDEIFCSCEFGLSKQTGLFSQMLAKVKEPAQTILHIGEDSEADARAAADVGCEAIRFLHYDNHVVEMMRMQIAAATVVDPRIRHTRSPYHPYKGLIADSSWFVEEPASLIGYVSLGPILYAFSRFIYDEVEQMNHAGMTPKVIFLLKNSYLPSLAFDALAGLQVSKTLHVSDFVATAASFFTREDLVHFLIETAKNEDLVNLTQQLLLPKEMAASIISMSNISEHPRAMMTQIILHDDDILQTILEQSAKYRARVAAYLQKQLEMGPEDQLLFVDIDDHECKMQRMLTSIFQEQRGIEVMYRYLILENTVDKPSSVRAMIDSSWCGDKTLEMIYAGVPALKEACAANEDSVVNYDDNGNPIFSKTIINHELQNKNKLYQSGCMNFVEEIKSFLKDAVTSIPMHMVREAAAVELVRRAFLPSRFELQCSGVSDTKERRSALHRSMQFPEDSTEMRAGSLELALSLMTRRNYNLEFASEDLSLQQETIKVAIVRGQSNVSAMMNAHPTHDGYFSLCIPAARDVNMGILFGMNYSFVQIDCVELVDVAAFLNDANLTYAKDSLSQVKFNQMVSKGGKLFECMSQNSFLTTPPIPNDNKTYVLRVVFRPIVMRELAMV